MNFYETYLAILSCIEEVESNCTEFDTLESELASHDYNYSLPY